jgi:5-methylcytosine-specific restriction endonuclease McrA
MVPRVPLPQGLLSKLIAKTGGTCAICGLQFGKSLLQLAHVIPISAGGQTTEDNLLLLCANCHAQLDRVPREIEFATDVRFCLDLTPALRCISSSVVGFV